MIDKTTIIKTVISRLQQIPVNHYLDIRTYKRNRSVLIVKRGEDDFLFIEDGFYKQRYEISAANPTSPKNHKKPVFLTKKLGAYQCNYLK